MPKNEQDPAASTQQFRAFANRGEHAEPAASGPGAGLIAAVVVAVLVLIGVAAYLLA